LRKPSGAAAQVEKGPDFDLDLAKFSPRQMEAVRLLDSGKIKFLLYGGALGGGKSYFLRWWCIRRLNILARAWGIKQPVGMLACEDYPSLKDRQLAKISREVPRWIGSMVQDHKDYGRCLILQQQWGGGVLCFRNLDDPSKYASAEFAFIGVDELTKNTYEVFDHLRTRLRWEGLPDIECQFAAGTNPGSIGHGWVKQFWMDKLFPPEWVKPIDYRQSFAYVPSLADDNPHLDASYWAMLETLPPTLRKAFRDGNWDVFIGQAFPDFSKDLHGIAPVAIPRGASIYLTHDYGFAKPFSFGWWWVDGDGRVYRFHEWYGWNGQPDTGMRLADSAVAEQLIEMEKRILPSWCKPDMVHRLAGPDLFAKQPDKKGGGQGPPTSETYAEIGRKLNHQLIFRVGDPTRHLKIRQFHERLRVLDDGRPMMYVYKNTCEQFFRTVSSLIMDEHKVEDIDTKGEDHQFDEACHIMMARPLKLPEEKAKLSQYDKRLIKLERGDEGSYDTMATMEQAFEIKRLESGRDSWDSSDDEDGPDGGLLPTA